MSKPTPETDAFAIKFKTLCGEKYWVPVDIARKLERERDEANEELHKQLVQFDQLFDEAEKIRIERDEAREENAKLRDIAKRAINIPQIIELSDGTKCVRLEDFLRERDEANELLASEKTTRNHIIKRSVEVERERDEAREKVEQQRKEIVRLNGATNHAGGTPLKIALRERDEAREAMREAWLAMDETHGTDRMINWQNKYAYILEETK